MASSSDKLDMLEKELSRLSTVEDKLKLVESYVESITNRPKQVFANVLTAETVVDHYHMDVERLKKVMEKHAILSAYYKNDLQWMETSIWEEVKPLERIPCANAIPASDRVCSEEGTKACFACELVSYCSKACQKKHWPLHKQDCKDPMRSTEWKQDWVMEHRSPAYLTLDNTESMGPDWQQMQHSLSRTRAHLWGNIPAYDILASARGKVQSNQDFKVAFTASGDLRNVVQTVNSLPSDYSGQLTIVLNDKDPHVTLRNMILLSLLGSISDVKAAAEAALHLWYSVCIPSAYHLVTIKNASELIMSMDDGRVTKRFSSSSSLSVQVANAIPVLFWATFTSSTYGVGEAAREYQRVQLAPSRVDYVQRWLCLLEPSHRVSCMEHRRFGLVLPFGALNAHFNFPNHTLFSPKGEWLQNNSVNPLDGWDLPDVLKTGIKHGASRSDLYGCLYFFLTDQLRTFAERIRHFRISFHMFDQNASDLNQAIRTGQYATLGIPSTIRFDRIDVSNIMDAEYLGIPKIISQWGNLLATSPDATLLGYFMNWVKQQRGATLSSLDNRESTPIIARLMKELVMEGKVDRPSSAESAKDFVANMSAYMMLLNTKYEDAKQFEQYLVKFGMPEALNEAHLKQRSRHLIVPHRIGAQISSATTTLPVFSDKESWYLNACVSHINWTERFVEIVRA